MLQLCYSLVNESTALCKDFTEVVRLFTGFIETPEATGQLFQDKKQLVEVS